MSIDNYKDGKCNKCMHNSVELCSYLDDWPIVGHCDEANNHALYVEYDGRYGHRGPLEYNHITNEWREDE